MEQNKNRYELIIGFVTLIISFSAFKDELKETVVNLNFLKFNLADYLLKLVYGFGFCVYLYIIERIARQSKRLGSWRIIDYTEKLAFAFFVFLILTPIFLALTYLVVKLIDTYSKLQDATKSRASAYISSLIGLIIGVVARFVANKYFKSRSESRKEEIEKEEIRELENAIRLYDNNFYSQAILEAFKVLELHLIRLFANKKINIPRNQFSFNELFKYAIKQDLISNDDIELVNEIRKMRNAAAHLNIEHTKEQATKAIEFIKYLIEKTQNNSGDNT